MSFLDIHHPELLKELLTAIPSKQEYLPLITSMTMLGDIELLEQCKKHLPNIDFIDIKDSYLSSSNPIVYYLDPLHNLLTNNHYVS